jgi:hypothetical protein
MIDVAAVKTYRYLRISMVGAVVLLGVSILIERSKVDCWQTSVSAYYYTPVRAIFVGVLMAIGLCLIVIKPTTDVGRCWSQSPGQRPVDDDGNLASWVVANIDNNITALLITGIVGLVVAAVIASVATRNLKAVAEVGDLGMRIGLLAAMVFLIVGGVLFVVWDDFDTRAHGIAAVLMFLFLALAVGGNAWVRRDDPAPRAYFWLYTAIAAAMLIAPAVMFPLGSDWNHMVLVLEATEITLFAIFWLVQTKEHWRETV